MAEHYSKEDIELYRNHQMSVLGQIACSAHLKECPTCAKLLEELKDDDLFLHDLRASVKIYDMLSKEESQKKQLNVLYGWHQSTNMMQWPMENQ